MTRRVRTATRVVKASIPIVGLEGQAVAESRCVHSLLGVDHELAYGNQLGEQLTFKFVAELLEADQSYKSHDPSDTVTKLGREWHHVGTTLTGSTDLQVAVASIQAARELKVGSCRITYSVGQRLPFARPYTDTKTVPLT